MSIDDSKKLAEAKRMAIKNFDQEIKNVLSLGGGNSSQTSMIYVDKLKILSNLIVKINDVKIVIFHEVSYFILKN